MIVTHKSSIIIVFFASTTIVPIDKERMYSISTTIYSIFRCEFTSTHHEHNKNGRFQGKGRETVFTCLYPNTVQTRLSRDQRPTKPVSRLRTGRGVGGS